MATTITNTSITTDNVTTDDLTSNNDIVLGGGRTTPSTAGGVHLSDDGINVDIVSNGRTAGLNATWASLRIHPDAAYEGLRIVGDTSQSVNSMSIVNSVGTSQFTIDSDGRMNTPVQPHVRGTFASSGGAVAANTNAIMNSPIEARGGITHDATNQRLTVTKPGRYLIYGQLLCEPSGGYTYFGIRHNGGVVHHAHYNMFGATNVNNGDHISSTIMTLNANDYIEFRILYQPLNNYYGGAHSQYYMYMLG